MDRREFLTSAGRSILGGIVAVQYAQPLSAEEQLVNHGIFDNQARQHISFDDGWKFVKGDTPHGEHPEADDHSWLKVILPHDWSIEGPFREDNPSGPNGAYLPGGIGWYRKWFTLPQTLRDKHVEIEFDGVYENSDVWINGHHLGQRPYGYISFNYDLTPYLQFGDKENILAVRVNNSNQPNSRWYSGSGIYRHVWLTTTNQLRVDHWGTFVRTPTISSQSAEIEISTRIRNSMRAESSIRLVTTIRGADSREESQAHEAGMIAARSEQTFTQRLKITNPQLWSPDQPSLYLAVTKVYVENELVDEYLTPFGVRHIAFDANGGFSLNGQPVKLKGVCIHHDLGALGAAFNDSAMERRLTLLKAMGCNAIRMSHNPPAPQLLDMCDRMGFLVMDEAFDEWRIGKKIIRYGYHCYFDQWASTDLKSMIERDRNHPSIILWSVGNEIPEEKSAEGVATAKMLAAIVRQEDPSRPVTCAINNIERANKSGFSDVFDVVGYNGGGGSSFEYDADHQRFPARRIFASESPHTAQTRGVYVSDENYCSSYDSCFKRINSEGGWKLVQERPFVAGAFRWAGIDYLGEPSLHQRYFIASRDTPWPARSSDNGVIDTCGFEKDIYYFYQSQWTRTPMLHIFPHWNWEGMEGKPIFIWCYTNCDSVELFLNDHSLGAQHPVSTSGYHLAWQVPYTPGCLRAVGIRNGVQVCEKEIQTAGSPNKLVLRCDSNGVMTKDRSISHVSIDVVDRDGFFVPYANNRVQFQVQGEGRLIGVDNGDPLSHQSFQGSQITAFRGRCLAIIQSTGRGSQVSLHATSPGLESAVIAL